MSSTFSNQPQGVSTLDKTIKEARTHVSKLYDFISHAAKPVPTATGDGTELNDTDYHTDAFEALEAGLADLSHMGISDFKTLEQAARTKLTGEVTNDKTYFMEHLIQTAAKLPQNHKLSKKLTDTFLTQLWTDLQHPPLSYLGDQFKYRQADGSYNSLKHPMLGAANTPYARTVAPKAPQAAALPDPGVIFDSIMARKVHKKHPNQISSMLFYLASIIIHDLFRTDHENFSNSKTSSYLDLSPLYGSNADEQKAMRTFKDGKLKPDCFSETRLLMFPPGVGVLLIMFNRFHNYVVEELALINEGGRFTRPAEGVRSPHLTLEQHDEELFQVGRLITCGLYVNCILLDYVRTILNLNQTDDKWALNPRADIPGVETACGNQVSAEFNLVYRWHSTISDRDEKWMEEELWQGLFPGKKPKEVSQREFLTKLGKMEKETSPDPIKRPFHNITRKADGTLDDDALVKIVTEGIEDCANSYGAQRIPTVMRAIEILGMQQARAWNVATLNEFRKYFKLEPHRTFEDINSDPHVAEQLKRLYDHPDLVEMYPGLIAEEAKQPMVPGSGLCPGYTISRAVLSDAVALVRGDRFYTIDYHPKQLTNWGYALVESDKEINNGAVFYKLFLRAFPNHFKQDSIYAHYPLTVPSKMKQVLGDLGNAHKYSFDRPQFLGVPKLVYSYAAAEKVLGDKATFNVTWGPAIEFLMGKPAKNFMLAGDGYGNEQSRKMMSDALYIKDWEREVKEYYTNMTTRMLKERSYKLGDLNQVDIIRDVGNLVHVRFCADLFAMPLKTDENPHGIFTERELYMILAAVFTLVFFDLDKASSFPLHQKALAATQSLGKLVEIKVKEIQAGSGLLNSAASAIFPKETPLAHYGKHMIERLLHKNDDVKDLVWGHILGTAGGMVPNQGQLFGQTIEYFLNEGKSHLPAMRKLALRDDPASFDTLMKYMLEGSRLGGETGVFRRATRSASVTDGEKTVSLAPNDVVMVHLRAASRDPAAFPDPDSVKLDRPLERYIHLGAGAHQCLGLPMMRVSLTAMLRVILRECPGLRTAPGPQGAVGKVEKPLDPVHEAANVRYHGYLTEMNDSFFPFPCALKVNWDDADQSTAVNGTASS
ncbi:uncharacterized protein K452DRAFT_272071 [Aplosporella prunicola CBS 121167]|uniref:Linoleate 8R-lipoxygenase n=1 Tax=Aplosporella prunicola CBS 121167 TaxID=1176127 RepID=A0A6A6BEG2_9PEZI|nr:uncharacterized protein K452DRAFT_272071 [Aplosporella prunicola CBS 121167]KAF2141317.1 hypothetical protein K452DRAFT_272071 [Aplosporella prunicola CBS 121167]